MDRGLEIHHDGDLPARSGMGSSSSFTVGLLHALYALKGKMPSKQQLAEESIHIEQNLIRETVGSQDQVSAAHGGLNQIVFYPGGAIHIRPVTISSERLAELNSHLMLFYTGIKRTASDVASSYVEDIDCKKRQLRVMKDLVDEALELLGNGHDIRAFGELLNETWQMKRSLSCAVSNPEVDELYASAKACGAIGGKLTGAGGGGFLLLFAPPEAHAKIKETFSSLIHVPFKFEYSGSQIIFVDRQEDFSALDRVRTNQCLKEFVELSVQ
jgi:D-glycero-alpha-D-manno-heptose-7-phosphate kinase